MAILVFSDIHGSLPVARQMATLIEQHSPSLIALLGDILYHGPRNPQPHGYEPGAVAHFLTPFAKRIVAVKGNCDSEVDEMVLPFPLSPLFTWIVDNGMRILATHGHKFGPQHLPPLAPGDVLLSGHTHVPKAETTPEGIHLCNPGSLALPKNGTPPCYGLFKDGLFQVLTAGGSVHMELCCR